VGHPDAGILSGTAGAAVVDSWIVIELPTLDETHTDRPCPLAATPVGNENAAARRRRRFNQVLHFRLRVCLVFKYTRCEVKKSG
jgi:hypothetical protein